MKPSTFTVHRLRGLMHLASAPLRRATLGEIAVAYPICEHPVPQVAQGLGRGGWLAHVRGNHARGKLQGLARANAPRRLCRAAAP